MGLPNTCNAKTCLRNVRNQKNKESGRKKKGDEKSMFSWGPPVLPKKSGKTEQKISKGMQREIAVRTRKLEAMERGMQKKNRRVAEGGNARKPFTHLKKKTRKKNMNEGGRDHGAA